MCKPAPRAGVGGHTRASVTRGPQDIRLRPMRCRRPRLTLFLVLVLGLAATAVSGCTTSYDVENREIPVHVWLTAPGLVDQGGTIHALIYVGSRKVVEGPVRFPAGVPTVTLPTVYLRTGDRMVSVILDNGRLVGREEVEIEAEGWVQVTVTQKITIRYDDKQPSPWGRE